MNRTLLTIVVCLGFCAFAVTTHAEVVFEQQFTSSTTVGDYIGEDESYQFTAATISADPGTPSYSVVGGEFIVTIDPDTLELPGATAEFGTSGLDISSSLMSMEITMTISNDGGTSNANPRMELIVGYGSGAYRDVYNVYVDDDEIEIAQKTTSAYCVLDSGVPFTITIYQNDSGSSETYTGPDGEDYTLDDAKAAFFIDGELVQNNMAINKDSVSLSQGFQFRVNTRTWVNLDDCELAIDSITVCDDLGVAEIPTVDIMTPLDCGTATGSPYYAYMEEAFDDQPTWDEEYEEPVGDHLDGYSSCLQNGGAYGYIDFGPYWWETRITQTWTRYRSNAGPTTHTPPDLTMWWDDDIDSTNDSDLNETTLDFGQKVFTASIGATWPWFQDVDATNDPVIPQARYLIIGTPDPVSQKMNEFAFVGYTQIDIPHPPEPPSSCPTLTLPQPQVFDYQNLTLVDEVDCGDAQDPHTLYESSSQISSISTILSDSCRTLSNASGAGKYFGYKIGTGCGLVAGKAYVLVVEYPEDQPRSMFIYNYGCETPRGLHTGTTLGDALHPIYVKSGPESLHYGLSGEYRTAEMLFHLHDRTSDLEVPRAPDERPNLPADGFYVVIGQLEPDMDPTSAGAAVRRIALYEAPSMETYTQALNIPEGLPQRHLFSREEMADTLIAGTEEEDRGLIDPQDFFENKMMRMKFLGFNTFCSNLLEFGANQGWDPSLHGGSTWFCYNSDRAHRWDNLQYLASQYGLNILPYYEYEGSISYPTGTGLGDEERAETLSGASVYTHISWCETANVDLTDPDTLTDAQKLLDCTALTQGKGKPIGPGEGADTSDGIGSYPGGWGYIDFGPDWDDVRITATWTKSWDNREGDASPYQALYWHDTPSEFLSGGQYVVPQDAEEETTLNFLTKDQYGPSVWTNDVQLDEQSAITPQARYLVMHAADPLTHAREFAVVGWIEDGGDPEIDLLTGLTGGTIGTTGYWHNPGKCFDNQPLDLDDTPAKIVGAWFRHRPSSMPIGFGDDTRERFSDDCYGSQEVTRTMLQSDEYLLADYYDWWMLKRKDFFDDLRDYLRDELDDDEAAVLYTWDHSASPRTDQTSNYTIVTDDPDLWENTYSETPLDFMVAVQDEWHYWGMLKPVSTWSFYEWHHSCPWPDPENYLDDGGAILTYSFAKLYTVSSWSGMAFDAFRSDNDLAMIRLHCLNEDCLRDEQEEATMLGYFCCDWDMAGPYCMLAEARAVAYGDPYYIGYHESDDFQRLFPGYVREFNANFLALPALPMTTEYDSASNEEVVVRSIDTPSDGTWLAVINIGFEDREDVVVELPVSGTVTDAVTGSGVTVTNGTITLDLWPGQLKSFHIE